MADSMFEIEHKPGEMLTIRVRPPKLRHISPVAKEHIKTAQKEFLLAFRSMIDMVIEMTETEDKPDKGKRARKIDVT